MRLWLEIALVAAGTATLVVGLPFLVARVLRLLRLDGAGASFRTLAALPVIGVRLGAALLLAGTLAASGSQHRVALVFTVGATYFAATLVEGVVRYRNRETSGCSTR